MDLRLQNLREDLEDLEQKNLRRHLEPISHRSNSRLVIRKKHFINFSSNDYLGLARHPRVIAAAAQALKEWGAGSGASRLISGNLKIHADLEAKLAAFKKEAAAVVFSSGYLANIGVVTSLLNEKDLVLVDRLSHASLVDAARLSRAKLWTYPHKNVSAVGALLERGRSFRRKLVVTDAYFSMDGDIAPLSQLLEMCRKQNAMLMIDEAHSTGVFGKSGRGLSEHFGLEGKIDVVMGTLSKSLGSVGGFVAGPATLKDYLVNRAREFIYTTAPSPAASAAALESLKIILRDPTSRDRLWQNVRFMRERLQSLGFDLMGSEGPIIPVWIGDTAKSIQTSLRLKKRGIYAPMIRPPTVPKNTDRIRFSISASHQKEELEETVKSLEELRDKIL